MDTSIPRHVRVPQMKVLALCLALALGGSTAAANPSRAMIGASQARLAHAKHSDLPLPRMDPSFAAAVADRMRTTMVRTPPAIPASFIAVTNCNDSGAGSFRDAVSNAASGDLIDLTSTGCSTITLTTGSVIVSPDDLTLQGPGVASLVISGNDGFSPIQHIGSGTLTINDLSVAHGSKYSSSAQNYMVRGGCIFSTGTVALNNAEVSHCIASNSSTTYGVKGGGIYGKLGVTLSSSAVILSTAASYGGYAYGGGIYTRGDLDLSFSVVSGNVASTTTGGDASGGGGQVGKANSGIHFAPGGSAVVRYSSLIDNSATSSLDTSVGGGLYTTGNVVIEDSTLAFNSAQFGGGLYLQDGPNVTTPFKISQSTVSGNEAGAGAGILVQYDIDIYGSTITANIDRGSSRVGAGLDMLQASAVLQSSIISGNSNVSGSTSQPDDIYGAANSVTGANNLIAFANVTLPSDTSAADPLLRQLAYNGGSTATHAIAPESPAINAGNNAGNDYDDQRGSGFRRVIGASADIGAYEFNLEDLIFANGFD